MNFQAEVGEQMAPEPETHPSKSWREIIRAVAAEKRRDALEAFLKEQLTEVLRLAPGQRLDTNQPLVTLGLDSLMALQLKKQIENRMALDVSVIQFLGRESLDDLVNMLFLNLAEGQDGAVRTVAGEAVAKREELPNDVIEGVI
jgi:aryl carrier-like protein